MIIALTSVLFMITLLYVAWPLIMGRPEAPNLAEEMQSDRISRRLADLDAEKNLFYSHIKDLEFEHAMGKIGDDEFHGLREQFKQRVVPLIREMDTLSHLEERLDEDIEASVARLRGRAGTLGALPSASAAASLECPSCHSHNAAVNRYCGQCGAPLAKARQL